MIYYIRLHNVRAKQHNKERHGETNNREMSN